MDWIVKSDRLDWLARRLNAAYALPEDIHVVVMEDTHGPAYFPEYRAITMPPEFLDTILYLFNRDYRWDDPDGASNAAISAFSWALLHEAGHALIDVLGLPVTGLEEDAADQFATVFATSLDRPWRAYHAAVMFRALGQNRRAPGVTDYWDEHALHEQRDTNILCWVFAYDPHEFVFIPSRSRKPPAGWSVAAGSTSRSRPPGRRCSPRTATRSRRLDVTGKPTRVGYRRG